MLVQTLDTPVHTPIPTEATTPPTDGGSYEGYKFSFEIHSELLILFAVTGFALWRQYGRPLLNNQVRKLLQKRTYEAEMQIQHLLAEGVGRTNAHRALLYEFHNGDKLSSGRHFNKVSITNQYVQSGYAQIKEIKDQPVAVISTMLEEFSALLEHECREVISTIRVHNDAPDLYSELMQNYNVAQSIYYLYCDCHHTTHSANPTAIIEFQFDRHITKEELEKERQEIESLAGRICFELKRHRKEG